MGFRFLPRGLFKALSRYELRLRAPKPPVIQPREDRYGDGNTIHSSGEVNVEIGPAGEVVAVWFRCRLLPFTSNHVGHPRAVSMNQNQRGLASIKAIVFEDSPR